MKLKSANWEKSYNILCKAIGAPGKADTRAPFGNTLCRIEPLGFATEHSHLDQESFFIIEGNARIQINGDSAELESGDVVYIPAHSDHRIENTSATEALTFLSTYWISPTPKPGPDSVLVIPAPPTPNGPLHVGHLSGPYLAADVYARAQRGSGRAAAMAMGTDDNQCYVQARAVQFNLTGEGVCAKYVPLIQNVLERFGCDIRYFLKPLGQSEYTDFVRDFFTQLVDKGIFELRDAPTLFCEGTNQFVYGAQVSGGCPNCGQTTGGHGCEECGHYNDCVDLINPKSNLTGEPVSLKRVKRYYFPLSRYTEKLRKILSQVQMHPGLRSYYEAYLEKGLPDVSVSQLGQWGIATHEIEGQVIYEWAEMAAGYFYIAQQVAAQSPGSDYWRDSHSGVVETFGFDNAFFYGLLLPAMMGEGDPSVKPPKAFLSNQFYQLDGKKFSTSRNHAIWGHEILEQVPADCVRLFLCLTRSEDGPTNFSLASFESYLRMELVEGWEGFFSLIDSELEKNGGRWNALQSMTGPQERYLLEATRHLWQIESAYAIENFSLRTAADQLSRIITLSRSFVERHRTDRNAGDNLSLCLSVLQQWTSHLEPVMPQLAVQLKGTLGSIVMQGEVTLKREEQRIAPFGLELFSKSLQGLRGFIKDKA